jgi:hypothetical protein
MINIVRERTVCISGSELTCKTSVMRVLILTSLDASRACKDAEVPGTGGLN